MSRLIFETKIDDMNKGKTIKEVIQNLNLSHRIVVSLKNNKGILINGENKYINHILDQGDLLQLYLEDASSENIVPEYMELDIIFEDDELLAVNKPAGLVVHPTTYHFTGTLANGVVYYFNEKGLNCKFRPVNRLDKDTSGVVLLAKSQLAHSVLSAQMSDKTIKKEYIAVVHNSFDELKGIIDVPIARKPGSIIERVVDPQGQNAVTEYKVISQNEKAAIIKINLLTGRTHQIRVHFSHIGHALIGDEMYGGSRELIGRQALHCCRLVFNHPKTGQAVALYTDVSEDIKMLCQKLDLDYLT